MINGELLALSRCLHVSQNPWPSNSQSSTLYTFHHEGAFSEDARQGMSTYSERSAGGGRTDGISELQKMTPEEIPHFAVDPLPLGSKKLPICTGHLLCSNLVPRIDH